LLVSELGVALPPGLAEAELLGLAELAPAAAPLVVSGIVDADWLVLQVSEIMFTDVTDSEELSLPRAPCTST